MDLGPFHQAQYWYRKPEGKKKLPGTNETGCPFSSYQILIN
jgi:hypothetical protein